MKSTVKLFIFVGAFVVFSTTAVTQTPRDQFKTAVAEYQKSATNENALKVIELFKQIDPPPAVPEEAREPFVMANTMLKKASDTSTAAKAVESYDKAIRLAPWWADAYFNRALAHETAGQFDQAIDDLKLYLEFKLTDDERREAQDKIYSLKAEAQLAASKNAEAEQAAAARAAAETPQAREAALLKKVEGARFVVRHDLGGIGSYDEILEIRGGMLFITIKIYANNTSGTFYGKNRPGEYRFDPLPYTEGSFKHTSDQRRIFTIRPDGHALMESFPDTPVISPFPVTIEK